MRCQILLVHAAAALLSTTAVAIPLQSAARQVDSVIPVGSLQSATDSAVAVDSQKRPSPTQTVGDVLGLGKRQSTGFIDPELLAALLPLLAGGGGTPGQGLQALMNAQQNSGQGRTTVVQEEEEEEHDNSMTSNAGGVVEVPAATTRPQSSGAPAVIPVSPAGTNATANATNTTDSQSNNARRADRPTHLEPLHAVIGVTRVTE